MTISIPVGNAVDVLVRRLRRKVDLDGEVQLLHSSRGVGYVMTDRPRGRVRCRSAGCVCVWDSGFALAFAVGLAASGCDIAGLSCGANRIAVSINASTQWSTTLATNRQIRTRLNFRQIEHDSRGCVGSCGGMAAQRWIIRYLRFPGMTDSRAQRQHTARAGNSPTSRDARKSDARQPGKVRRRKLSDDASYQSVVDCILRHHEHEGASKKGAGAVRDRCVFVHRWNFRRYAELLWCRG